jgi:septum formation protein
MQHLVLASSSPRRKELLSNLGISFEVSSSSIEEKVDPTASPAETVISLAEQKSLAVASRFPNAIVIGADTIVTKDAVMLGKPKDEQDAFRMLKTLSGQTHSVFTGVAIVKNGETTSFYVETEVVFWPLSDVEIHQYIQSKEPFDKAGAYGIQGLGAVFVREIKGDYFSVVGLPVSRLVRELKQLGFQY